NCAGRRRPARRARSGTRRLAAPSPACIALPGLAHPHARLIPTTRLVPPRPLAAPTWLVLLAAVALGWQLGRHHLLDPDEGRNAEVAREMAQSNDYLVPRLDGLPYLDKPIVYFAAAAGAMELLGPTETAGRRWGLAAGAIAALAYATTVLPLAYARTAIFDSTLTLCTTAAILWFAED